MHFSEFSISSIGTRSVVVGAAITLVFGCTSGEGGGVADSHTVAQENSADGGGDVIAGDSLGGGGDSGQNGSPSDIADRVDDIADQAGSGEGGAADAAEIARDAAMEAVEEITASCGDCQLPLQIVERDVRDGVTRQVVVALDYAPTDGDAQPAMADFRLEIDGPARLMQVGMGAALLDAEKELVQDSRTGKPYVERDDGSYQFVLLSTRNTNTIGAGRLLLFRLALVPGEDANVVRVRLVQREQTFAPTAADATLWGVDNGGELVLNVSG